MTKLVLRSALLGIGAAIILAVPVRADIISNLGAYDSPGYDFVTSSPPAETTIGTFTFTIPVGDYVTGITISGTFGNGDSPTTALSDYYLGFAGTDATETEVPVAFCDDPNANCASAGSPTAWSATLTPSQIAALGPGLAAGSLDFTYTWDTPTFAIPGVDLFVYAGPATLDIAYAPEPSTVLFCLGGFAGVVLFRRFRKV